jgi:DNA-binding PadR family transcriptional regulator
MRGFVQPRLLLQLLKKPAHGYELYELTDQGIEFLHAWAASIRATRAQLDRFLAGYEEQFQIKTEA